MQKLLTKINKKEGYISIETIIIGGLLIGLGSFLIVNFTNSGHALTMKGNTNIDAIDFEKMSNFTGQNHQ